MLSKIIYKIQDIFFPVSRKELPFFLPMSLMMMLALYNFATLRSVKDSLIVSNIGAESISFLKLWLVLPSAILFTFVYLKLSNKYNLERIFYLICSFFLLFFAFFCFCLYPNKEILHFNIDKITEVSSRLPHLKWFFMILGHWTFALMYIFCELWSVVTINLIFWQFANNVVSKEDARRFYPLFGLVGNFGLIIAGNAMVYFSDISHIPKFAVVAAKHAGASDSDLSMKLSIISVILAGLCMMVLMRFLNKYILKTYASQTSYLTHADENSKTTKLTISDSIRLIYNSSYIWYITVIIICYSLAINILEGPWKAKIRELCPTQTEYLAFMGHFNIWMGVSCVLFMFVGSNIVRVCSWRVSALATPGMIGVTGLAFFVFFMFSKYNIDNRTLLFDPLLAAVIAGAAQNILSKSFKYSLFDSTKEIAYMPLDNELRSKGKAAAEVIGSKVGKSLGAIIQSGLFIFFPNLDFGDLTPILLPFFLIIIIAWIGNVVLLSAAYEKISKE
ncbi:MAG: Npt1/Npt2 family nucleotide transporter [Rickettsiaceae bacterium]|nr:Npt1/Npt2 family nucleotide transporter [Rickettsiaceae bacterium]